MSDPHAMPSRQDGGDEAVVRGRPTVDDPLRHTTLYLPQALLREYKAYSGELSIPSAQLMRTALTLYARVLSRSQAHVARSVSDSTDPVAFRRRRR